ncbi:hypothetical protein DEO72_LG1g2629 [Vigna unguiculata]|uniref:Uncharacterized protein n=1 Tax=Vigna unguiculata TaxID=3917 RepID=A0A4D6KN63_VIGUN|nr:hypothetical protein DEO72_LG1g2629 [Vigna unguiculata]
MLKRKRPGKKSGKSGWWNGSAWAHRKLVDASNPKYDVNKDVVNELDSSPKEEVAKVAATDDANPMGDKAKVVEVDAYPVA